MTDHNEPDHFPDARKMVDLAARIERAEGPVLRELECEVYAAHRGLRMEWQGQCLVIDGAVVGWIDPGQHQRNFSSNRPEHGPASIPAYLRSIDAAMQLVPSDCEVRTDWLRYSDDPSSAVRYEAFMEPRETLEGESGYSEAPTLAQAIAAAAIRARSAS